MLEEGAGGELADQRFVDRGAGEIEGGQLLGERQERGIFRADAFGQDRNGMMRYRASKLGWPGLFTKAAVHHQEPRHQIDLLPLPKFLPGRADVVVALVVIVEVVARRSPARAPVAWPSALGLPSVDFTAASGSGKVF